MAIAIAAEAVRAAWNPYATLNGIDSYPFLTAARMIVESGVPRVDYWPNSSAGLDILFWSHHLLPYFYAAGVWLIDIGRPGLESFFFVELLLTLGVSVLVLRMLVPRPLLWVVAAFLFFEPGFNFVVVHTQYMRVPILFGLLSVGFLVALYGTRTEGKARWYAALCGMFAALAPLAFVGQGVPIAAGIGFAFLLETKLLARSGRDKLLRVAAFAGGAVLPITAVIGYLLWQMDPLAIRALVQSIGFYGGSVTLDSSLRGEVLSLGYFFSSIVVSRYGLAVLPIGMLAIGLNLLSWRRLDARERFVLRLTASCVAAWVALAMVVPTHFYAARMNWLVPLLIAQIWMALRDLPRLHFGATGFVAASIGILAAQLLHFGIFDRDNPYHVGIAAAIGLVLAGGGFLAGHRLRRWRPSLESGIVAARVPLAAAFAVILCAPPAIRYLEALAQDSPRVIAHWGEPDLATQVGEAARVVLAPHLSPGDWVVSDLPLREFFPDGVRIQSIQPYRGLFTGARDAPAKLMVMFGPTTTGASAANTGQAFQTWPEFGPAAPGPAGGVVTMSYRGYAYEVGPSLPLPGGWWVRIGSPDPLQREDADVRLDDVTAQEVRDYLAWRRRNGLEIE